MASADGLVEAAERMQQRSLRLRSLRKPLEVVAREIETATDNAFDQSKSPDGEAFPSLAESTLQARARASKGSRKRDEFGDLTKRAQAIRAKILAPGGAKPLVDTGRARNSQHARVVAEDTIEWSAVGYLAPHITGGRGGTHPPKRNVSVFERQGTRIVLNPAMSARLRGAIVIHVRGGTP